MNSKKHQNGSFVLNLIGILVIIIIVFGFVLVISTPNTTIGSDGHNNIELMVKDVHSTPFEPVLKKRIALAMQDGVITRREYSQLVDAYYGYNTSKITNSVDEYIERVGTSDREVKVKESTVEQKQANTSAELWLFSLGILCGAITFIVFKCVKR